jgi:hypothetical protein
MVVPLRRGRDPAGEGSLDGDSRGLPADSGNRDSLTALGLMIAFHYALSGIACAVYYRYEITKSVKSFS